MNQNETVLCSICEIELKGDFCYKCGQKYKPGKVSFGSMFGDIISNTFSIEKSLPADLFRMIKKPALLPENYLKGFSKYYSSPGKMILYSLTLLGFHLAFVSPEIVGLSLEMDVEDSSLPSSLLFFLFFLPFLSTTSYLSDHRQKYRKADHFITTVYTACSSLIILIVLGDILFVIYPNILDNAMALVYLIMVMLWTSISLFNADKWKNIFLHFIFNLLTFTSLVLIIVWLFN